MAASERPPQHPLLAPVVFLLGVWEGEGHGLWPAEPQFRYRERVEMTHHGGPFVAYRQTTTTLDASKGLHAEAGFIRPGPDGTVEMVVAKRRGSSNCTPGASAAGTCAWSRRPLSALRQLSPSPRSSGSTAHLEARLHRMA